MSASRCAHCELALPAHGVRWLEIQGQRRAYCCSGCAAAAQFILDAGLSDFYRLREAAPPLAVAPATDYSAWDLASFQLDHVERDADGAFASCSIALSGIRCAACAWLVQNAARHWSGVGAVEVNAATARARIRWRPAQIRLSEILTRLAQLGYTAQLGDRERDAHNRLERRSALKRIAVAGFGAMQAMMFSEALYFGGSGGMDGSTRDLFRWIAFAVATPVVFYSGRPFLSGAWREVVQRRPGMDFLVAVSTLIAYLTSLLETLRGGPVVYFDAAVMFVLFLSATRFIEQQARRNAIDLGSALARAQPRVVQRVAASGVEAIGIEALAVGDVVRLRGGEAVPADGVVLGNGGEFDESLLSGESRAIAHSGGDAVLAGSVVTGGTVDVRTTAIGTNTRLGQIARLIERAQATRSRRVLWAEQLAVNGVWALLAICLLTTAYWSQADAARALPILLAMLAITCPCALALAVPATLAAAHARLARSGILVLDPDALLSLAEVRTVAFDKTGTVTRGTPSLERVEVFAQHDAQQCLAMAAALERDALHSYALAFRGHDRGMAAVELQRVAGSGIQGVVEGLGLRLGRRGFATGALDDDDGIWLGDGVQAFARFALSDPLRAATQSTCSSLRARGIALALWSGDSLQCVAQIANTVGIADFCARMSPEDKLAAIARRQASGQRVAMVGDGINDGPVLAAADVSIAMASGAPLAHLAADIIAIDESFSGIGMLFDTAQRARRVLRQNLAWAFAYNAIALPFAALGMVAPWAAALGMSLSSLLVTLNAWRLSGPPAVGTAAAPARDVAHRPPAHIPLVAQ